MTRDELIAELEKAKGPSRELDWVVGEEFGIKPTPMRLYYTSSIDAAITLVPDGWTWCVGSNGSNLSQFHAGLSKSATYGWDDKHGISTTPAIAICIAALKARAL